MRTYYDHRADEYDDTTYARADPRDLSELRTILRNLPPARTLDIGCGTGWLSRYLQGALVGVDQSRRMLEHFHRRHPQAEAVHADVPPLPFPDGAFARCFSAHFASHLQPDQFRLLLDETERVGRELVLVEEQQPAGCATESWQRRVLESGGVFRVYKRYRTAAQLAAEIGGLVLLDNDSFIAVHRPTMVEAAA